MSYKTRARDQKVADEASEVDRTLMCPAHGCPCRWTVHGDRGIACSAHNRASHKDWPAITEQLQRDVVQRALERTNGQRTIA